MKKLFKLLGVLLFAGIVYYVWYVHFNYRFEEITKNKVYKSAPINSKTPNNLNTFFTTTPNQK